MRDAERQIPVRYSASPFTALAGVLVAKGFCSRQDIAPA
jgi:hypothetical protein